jgi:hypothetical protein
MQPGNIVGHQAMRAESILSISILIGLIAAPAGWASDLKALPESYRPDPFGGVVAADRQGANPELLDRLDLVGARGGYLSCHLVVLQEIPGPYRLSIEPGPHFDGMQVDLFREWFHKLSKSAAYYPDALEPVSLPFESVLPDPDNRIESQKGQAFWVDIWVPQDSSPGRRTLTARLDGPDGGDRLTIEITVLEQVIPDEDPIIIDHNTYGTSWLSRFYPALAGREGDGFFAGDSFFSLIHAYHRLFFEHRGTFHQLGYGHGGKTGMEFAPKLEGDGRTRRVADWTLYDKHYGPLLDGSAFVGGRRPARPIPFVYLPINPEWPASFLNWGEPGYEAEFVNVVSAMEQHFREKGWTRTRFEMFFNHKKRYKAFPWDGDETRFEKDLPFFAEYARLLNEAVPEDTPVQFVFRADASWLMEQQFREQNGIINFWVSGAGMFSWFDWAPEFLHDRGNIVWIYGGVPPVDRPSSEIAVNPLRAWLFGVDGYIHWLTTDPGPDPWFDFAGGGTVLAYPGDRFGLNSPIPSIRLKLQRNVVQDLALLGSLKSGTSLSATREEVARRFNGLSVSDWWTPRPSIADRPVLEWTNENTGASDATAMREIENLDAEAWMRVRDYLLGRAREVGQ